MRPLLIALSGPTYAGKTTLALELAIRFELSHLAARSLIQSTSPLEASRASLLELGAKLEAETNGRWLADRVEAFCGISAKDGPVLLDAVRTRAQLVSIRERWQTNFRHLHVTATEEVRRARFLRGTSPSELRSFDELIAHSTERMADALRTETELIVDTSDMTPGAVVLAASEMLSLGNRTA